MGPTTPAALLASGLAHPLILDQWLLKMFGAEYYTWDAEVLWLEAARAAKAPNISEVNRAKIEAVRSIVLGDVPRRHWHAFEKVTMALNGVMPLFEIMQRPSLGQILTSVDALQITRPIPLSDEIWRYISASLLFDDITRVPEALKPCRGIIAEYIRGGREHEEDIEHTENVADLIKEGEDYFKAWAQRYVDQDLIVARSQVTA